MCIIAMRGGGIWLACCDRGDGRWLPHGLSKKMKYTTQQLLHLRQQKQLFKGYFVVSVSLASKGPSRFLSSMVSL